MLRDAKYLLAALLLGSAGAGAAGSSEPVPDTARGQMLYERHCVACHTPGIHARRDKLPATRDELRALVDHFRRQASLGFTRDEIDDIVEYLSRTRYRFPPDK